jgi:hypothetical protein
MNSVFTTEQDRKLTEYYELYRNGKKSFWRTIVDKMNDEFKREKPFTHESLRSRFKIIRNKNKSQLSII